MCERERFTIWDTKEPCISDYIDWIRDWFPKDQVNLSAEDSGNPLVKLPLPLTKQQMSHCQPFAFWRNKGHFTEEPLFHVLECSDRSSSVPLGPRASPVIELITWFRSYLSPHLTVMFLRAGAKSYFSSPLLVIELGTKQVLSHVCWMNKEARGWRKVIPILKPTLCMCTCVYINIIKIYVYTERERTYP